MPTDYWLPVRQQVVARLKSDAALTALVSAASIYGEEPPANPTWPFIRIGLPISSPYEATQLDGSVHRVTVHAFAKGKFTDVIAGIADRIIKAMDTLETNEYLVDRRWVGTNVIHDSDEASAYHAVVEFDVTVAGKTLIG